MGSVPLHHFLILAAVLFAIGTVGVIVRRNALTVFLCIELMLNAGNLTFLAFARFRGLMEGHAAVFLVMAVAAAEAAVGLAIVVHLFRHRRTVDVDEAAVMRH